jgi:hypothetical protein
MDRCSCAANATARYEAAEEEGQVSFEFTKKEPRPAFRYNVKKQATENGVRFVTLVAPLQRITTKSERSNYRAT